MIGATLPHSMMPTLEDDGLLSDQSQGSASNRRSEGERPAPVYKKQRLFFLFLISTYKDPKLK